MDHGIGLALKRSLLDVIGTVENISFSDELEQWTLVLITYQSRRNNLHWHRYICSHSQHWIIGILQMFHQCTDPSLFPVKGLLHISLHAFYSSIRKIIPRPMRLYDFKAHDLFRGICTQFPRFPSFQLACKFVSDLYYFGCHEWSSSYPVIYSKLHIQVSLTQNTFRGPRLPCKKI